MCVLRLVSFIAVFFALNAIAQITGDLSGTVTDSSGAVVPNARVTLTSKETGAARTMNADAEGRFAFNLLQIGSYEVRAEAPAFRAAVTPATIRSGEEASVRFTLEVGQVTETVVVVDAVAMLDTTNAQVQVSIEGEKIQDLPVNRNPNNFAQMAPGVIPVSANNPFLASGSFNTNGSRGRANNITVDNITATDISVTGTGGVLGPLSFTQIKEVKLITNTFSAEYGRNAGAQLQYITRGGTNDIHGELFEYFKNDRLNARPFFDRTGKTNIVRYNDYGVAVGGPIIRNKVFFFGTGEWVKERGAGAARIAQVPTPAMLAQVTDATSRALLQQYQLPAAETISAQFGTVQQSASNLGNSRQWSLRGDWNITENDRLVLKWADYESAASSSGNTFVSTNLANFGTASVNHPSNKSVTYTRVVSPTVVNDFNFGYGRSEPEFPFRTTVPLGPRIQFSNAQVDRFGQWEGLPQGRSQDTFQFTDTLAWVRNAHSLKFGGEFFYYKADSYFDANQRPLITFQNWDAFAAGTPFALLQRFGSSVRANRVDNQFFFVQDDWRIRPNLTLNLGLRVERSGGPTETEGLITRLNTDCTQPMGAAGAGPLGCLETGGAAYESQLNWGPRVGIAWNPFSDNKTVVRAGFGTAYDFVYLNPVTNGRFLLPFITTAQLSGTSEFTGQNSYANIVAGTAAVQQAARAQVGSISSTATNFGVISPAIQGDLRNPQTHSWTLEVQREFWQGTVAKVRYVGTKSNFLQKTRSLNPIIDPRRAPATSLADEQARLAEFAAANTAGTAQPNGRSNRVDPRFNDVLLLDSSGNSNYHGLQMELQKRFSGGLFIQAAYTFGKSIDDGSDALGVLINDAQLQQNPYDNRDNRGPSQFDVRHRFVVSHVWEPTFFKSSSNFFLRHALGGWGFSGISSYRTGFPVTFESGSRFNLTPISIIGSASAPVRPNAAGPFEFNPVPQASANAPSTLTAPAAQGGISAYAASLGLSQPLLGNFGTIGRNTHRLDDSPNFDLNAYKNFFVTERVKAQIRAEFYNAFNNVSFQDVSRNISNAAFGQYTTTAQNARTIQLGARITF
jgi:outer membrane receptor protein involved in Fe transport